VTPRGALIVETAAVPAKVLTLLNAADVADNTADAVETLISATARIPASGS
jgi:hypothetical protein